jgi:hypothetical protein
VLAASIISITTLMTAIFLRKQLRERKFDHCLRLAVSYRRFGIWLKYGPYKHAYVLYNDHELQKSSVLKHALFSFCKSMWCQYPRSLFSLTQKRLATPGVQLYLFIHQFGANIDVRCTREIQLFAGVSKVRSAGPFNPARELVISKVKLSRYTPWRHMGGEEV